MTNQEIADLLRSVATALTLKKASIFQIRAYENAADSIEHSSADLKDLWEEGTLGEVPGIGQNLQDYLDELFKTGKVRHFEALLGSFPDVVYELIKIPGIGPKTALELANLGIKSTAALEKEIKTGQLFEKGFSAKIAEKIINGIHEAEGLKTGRMLLPFAYQQALKIIDYMQDCPKLARIDMLGSLRRKVATIGDLDFAASSEDPEVVIEFFLQMPGIKEVVSHGENKAMVVLKTGPHVDLLVGKPNTYGALLQHFTGSQHHSVALRTFAQKKGYSLSEYGVKNVKTSKVIPTETEDQLYKMLGMQTPPPELREDTGEIEVALAHKLPKLIELKDIKGDLHLHSNFPITKPSHGPGADSLKAIVEKAVSLGYQYVGLSDHSPSFRDLTTEQIFSSIAKRTQEIDEHPYQLQT